MTEVELIREPEQARALGPEWDRLAVANGRPQMAPAWVLAWWEHLASPATTGRIVAVREGGELIGLVPFFVDATERRYRIDYHLPGLILAAGATPLARAGREWDVAAAAAGVLGHADPAPDVIALEGAPLASAWGVAFRENWPGPARPAHRVYRVMSAPEVTLRHESFDGWMASRSANFRSQMRRGRRRFTAAGGSYRVSTRETLAQDIASFQTLHAKRWQDREESTLVGIGAGLARMLEQAGLELIDTGRFELRLLEIDGSPIGAQIFLFAGESVIYINGGWDPDHAELIPSQLGILGLIEDTIVERRASVLDLGLGEQRYKLRFADGNEPVAWNVLMPPRYRLPLTRARMAPLFARYALRDTALRCLPDSTVARIRRSRQVGRREAG